MSVFAWIVFGLFAGLIASKVVGDEAEGLLPDMVLGIVGSVVGGFLFNAIAARGVTGFNGWSLGVGLVGSMVVLFAYHALGRRASA